jgi:class 3 adenylate cyclase/CHASE2 domain-containing sensor protein
VNTATFRNTLGMGFVIAIALLCFGITMGLSPRLQSLEDLSTDFRMRLRLNWVHQDKRTDTRDLVLLAIDQTTENQIGRYGAGRWLSRGPFLDQLHFLNSYCSPSVVAYDIIFKDTQGDLLRKGQGPRVSEATNRTGRIAHELAQLSAARIDCVSDNVLSDLSQLALEQGNVVLAHGFAETWENGRFFPVLGFNFRGGTADPQSVSIPVWSEPRRAGTSRDVGGCIPYLRDIAIPSNSIHFVSKSVENAFSYAPNASLPSPDLWDYAYMGSLNIPRDIDGMVRRVPLVMGFWYRSADGGNLQCAYVPSFALLSVLLHLGLDTFPLKDDVLDVTFGKEIIINVGDKPFRIPVDGWGRMQLNYRWRESDFAAVSFCRLAPVQSVVSRDACRDLARSWGGLLRKRIAVVGLTVTGVDVGPTPINANTPLVYVQLTAINNILRRAWLMPVPELMRWGIMLTLLALFVALCLWIRSARVVFASLLLLLVYVVISYGGLHVGQVALPLVAPIVFMMSATFGVLTFRYFTESRDRRRIRGMFSTMVSGTVLSFLEDNPGSFSLEGHTTEATVLFSDISEFTTLSEHLAPADVIQLLNTYLTPVTDCVLTCGGYLDKYVGDSVMAVWGAPYADAQHALKACLSALDQQRIVSQLNDEIEATYGFRLRVRIGINSGEVTAGNVGSERKFQYTVLGDPVNLASRLEPTNRDFGTGIVIGEATQRLIASQLETREIGRILVAGREQVVTVYELLGVRGSVAPEILALRDQYATALERFYVRDWAGCREALEAILMDRSDGPSEFLLGRTRLYQEKPPPDDWQGVYERVEKD